MELLDTFTRNDLVADVESVNVVLSALERNGDWQQATRLLLEMLPADSNAPGAGVGGGRGT